MGYETNYKNKLYGIAIRIVETGELFETRTRCAEHLGVTVGSVSMCLSGKTKTCRGFHLEIVDVVFDHELTNDVLDELYSMTGCECEWRKHPERPNVYVSDSGYVAKNVRGRVELRKQHINNSGYATVSVGDLGTYALTGSLALVHRLVAETFIDNPYGKEYVNHVDGDKLNNAAYNLEWCTRSENMRHAFDTGLYKTEKVRVVETGKIYSSAAQCAKDINGSASGIHDCKSGRQKKHRGYHFEFLGGGD